MAASLCPLATQSGASCNAILVGLRKDWDEYLQKCLGKVTSALFSSVVIEEIIESPTDLGSLDSGKGKILPAIEGFTPLLLALPTVTKPASSSVQEGTAIFPVIQGFDPFILSKPDLGISGVFGLKALEAILPSLVVINLKTFSTPNLQTEECVIIRMPKLFPYEDSHCVPWKYNVSLISIQTGKEKVCSNISLGLSVLTRSGHCYTLEELEKRRKGIGKGTTKLVRNRVTTEEAEEFLKIIRNSEYSVIQQLNRLSALNSILALLLSSIVHHKALLKVLRKRVPTSATKSAFKGKVSTVLATNQISFTDDELSPEGG